jgi:hypothetical protein
MWIAQRGPARFFSQPMSVGDFPLLHLEVSGSSDLEGTVVRLESPDHSESSTPVSLLAGRWQAADLCVPGHPTVRLVVDVPPGPHWLALTEPVELGGGSWVTHWLLHRADLVEEISGGILVAAWAALLTLGWRSEADPDAAACAVAA